MKNLIMFFVLVMVMVFSSYEVSYSQETGNFYFLVGTEGNERAIMYLHIEGERAYGSYYTESQSIIVGKGEEGAFGFNGSFDGKNLKLSYHDDNDRERTITGSLSSDIVFRGKHNSKNINLSLANTPVNSARIIENKEDYFSGKKFTFNKRILNNLDYYGRIEEIAYLDENIITFRHFSAGSKWVTTWSSTYSINTGKIIGIEDFISNLNDRNLLALLRKKVGDNDNDEIYYSLDNYSFYITPIGVIFSIIDYRFSPDEIYDVYDEEGNLIEMDSSDAGYYITIEFTFEELKPFIKKNSPLDYLFN